MTQEPRGAAAPRFGLTLTAAGITLALFGNAFTPVNTDLGWMLSYGRKLLGTGRFLHENVESFTEPSNLVIRGDWLMCVLGWLAHQAAGGAGLVLAKWALIALSVALFARAIRLSAQSPLVQLVVTLAGVHLASGGYELFRTQLATMVLLAAVVAAGLSGRRAALWACVPAVALWTNAHGGATMGAVVVGLACVSLELEARLGWRPRSLRTGELGAIAALAVLALLCSPFAAGTLAMTSTIGSDNSWQLDREWIPLWRFGELLPFEWVGLALLGASLVVSAAWLPRRRVFPWALLVVGVGAALSASRHLRIAPLLIGPAVAAALDGALRERARRLEHLALPVASGAAVLLGALWALGAPAALALTDYDRPSPANALVVMRANGLSGKVWNEFDWGGLLIWALPEVKVAVDGRHLAAYSPRLLTETIRLGYDGADPAERVLRSGAEVVLLGPRDPALPSLARHFTPVYCDAAACVLSRVPEHLERAKQGLLVPTVALPISALYQDRAGPDAVYAAVPKQRVRMAITPGTTVPPAPR